VKAALLAGDGIVRAVPQADHTAVAFLGDDGIRDQTFTDFCSTFFIENMFFVFIPEIPDRG
jgi:hypothetical protein